jgi:hypothetical protein
MAPGCGLSIAPRCPDPDGRRDGPSLDGCELQDRLLYCCEVTAQDQSDAPVGSWRGWREAAAVVMRPRNLRRTIITALVVGTILFAINQLNVVADGQATPLVWIKTGFTYLVPFAVANVGILIATHR